VVIATAAATAAAGGQSFGTTVTTGVGWAFVYQTDPSNNGTGDLGSEFRYLLVPADNTSISVPPDISLVMVPPDGVDPVPPDVVTMMVPPDNNTVVV
jgi:hypothetical protein